MCGFVGCWSKRNEANPKDIEGMMKRIAHRGPDGSAFWFSDKHDVGLGHKRLAIIDLSETADQPMASVDGAAHIVFNGEIYNHKELREDLLANGIRFHTASSDTEVLLNGYLVWGLETLLKKLIGMYSFALFDNRKRLLHLVRDRVGIKPLSILRQGDNIYFASETKAFMGLPAFQAELNKKNLYHHLSFRSLPAPNSLFKNVEKVKPAQIITFNLDTHSEKYTTYWDPLNLPTSGITERQDALAEIDALMKSSMSYRMISDVPVGLFLSGGVDSTYLLSEISETHNISCTLTATFPDDDTYCESEVARNFAQKHATKHCEVPVSEGSFAQLLPKIAYFQDEPISAPICIPVFLLSKSASNNGVKVILSGEGSDELFVGYDSWAKVIRTEQALRNIPKWMTRLPLATAHGLLRHFIPPSNRAMEMLGRLSKDRPLFWGGAMDFCEREKKNLLHIDFLQDLPDTYLDIIDPIWNEFKKRREPDDISAWMSYIDLRFRLPELMLPRVDKMGMASSIEGRVPFLDHRLIEFYLSLPAAMREESSLEGKGMFKELAAKKLGNEFVYQKKRGFQVPVKEWKNGSFGHLYNPLLIEFAEQTSIFNPDAIRRLLKRKDDRLYFSLINLMLWYVNFIEDVIPDANLRYEA